MRRTVSTVLSVVMVLVMLTGCQSGLLKGLKKDGDDLYVNKDEKYDELVSVVREAAEARDFRGAMLIATDDEIIMFMGREAVTIGDKPVDPYTTYEIGSISKTFCAVLTMKLVEQGRLSMDDKLSKFFPDYEVGKDVTIYDLLHMQSGIRDYLRSPWIFFEGYEGDWHDLFENDELKDDVTDEDILGYLYQNDLVFETGTKFEYSNTNYLLLAMIVEKVEGKDYSELLQEEIFDPCGMEHTTSMVSGDLTSVPDSHLGYTKFVKRLKGTGEIHSCPADMLKFDKALFGGELLNPESLEMMKEFAHDEYGCGLSPYGLQGYGHAGQINSYVSENFVIETKWGRVYVLEFTSSWKGVDGLEFIKNQIVDHSWL